MDYRLRSRKPGEPGNEFNPLRDYAELTVVGLLGVGIDGSGPTLPTLTSTSSLAVGEGDAADGLAAGEKLHRLRVALQRV